MGDPSCAAVLREMGKERNDTAEQGYVGAVVLYLPCAMYQDGSRMEDACTPELQDAYGYDCFMMMNL